MYYSDELYHHGIKGQRWGRRNGPPYPLSPQTHAAVVRSAGRGKVGGLKEDSYNTERKKARNRNIASGILAADAAIGLARTPKVVRSYYEMTKSMFGPERAKKAALATGLLNAGLIGAEGLAAYKLRKSAKKHAATAEQISKSKIKGRVGGLSEEDTKYDPKFRTKAEREAYERRSARAQRIKKGVAIGLGAAALGGAGYLAYKNRQKLLSRRPNGSGQLKLSKTGNLALPGVAARPKGFNNLERVKMRNGKKVSSMINPQAGKTFKFKTRSTNTGIVPANTNRRRGFLNAEPRRLNWKRVAAAAGGAAGLAGGTAYGVSRYRKRRRSRR
jgi:hypothetical protein